MKPFVYDRPWAVIPEVLLDLRQLQMDGEGLRLMGEASARVTAARSAQASGGVAVLPLHGLLMQRASFFGTSLDEFTQSFRAALADPQVSAIVLDVDSPGGEVFGVQEVADEIVAAREQKKIIAAINPIAASGAYWIASAASEISMTPSGLTGSIGVYALHMDFSKAAEAAGVKPTFISAGKYKVEGNVFAPLDAEASAAIQERVNGYYDAFVRGVARGRGASMKTVREGYGEGRVVTAADAMQQGMVDRVGTLDQAIARALASAKRSANTRACAVCGGCGCPVAIVEAEPVILRGEICPGCKGEGYVALGAVPPVEDPRLSAASLEVQRENDRARLRLLELT